MIKSVWKAVVMLSFLSIFSSAALADTFEFLTFTPPAGWTKQFTNDGVVYKRATGIGAVSIYSSYPTTGTAADEYEKIWKARLGAVIPGGAPRPKLDRDGEYTVAIGGQQVNAQDAIVSFSLVTFVGKGRALGVVTLTAGDEVAGEVTSFLNTVAIGTSGAVPPNSTSEFDLDFDVPSGYLSKREGGRIVLTPITMNEQTPCVYGISPSRPTRGNLETDARNALLEPLPGWEVKGDKYNGMRGKSADGWQYLWLRTDVQLPGPSYQYLTAMTMAIESGPRRVSIVWGFGNPAHCLGNDIPFARLFASLKPRGWVSDGGRSLMTELVGTWRNTESVGMAQYRFLPNGRYEYGQGTSTTFGNLETRTGSVGEGAYSIQGSRLLLTGGRRAGSYLMRVYEEFSAGMWLKTISIINTSSNPPLEVRYMRVKD